MHLPLSLLMCVSVIQLSVGEQPLGEIIIPKKVHHVGDWSPMNSKSEEVQKVAHYAVEMFNTNSKCKKMFKLVSVSDAHSKVTNVISYKFNAVLNKTKCLKSENHALDSCSLDKKTLSCYFKIDFNPRDSKHELLGQRCNSAKQSKVKKV